MMTLIKAKCTNCGCELELDADHLPKFCENCGAKLFNDNAVAGDVTAGDVDSLSGNYAKASGDYGGQSTFGSHYTYVPEDEIAYPERYLNTASATVLMIIKLGECLLMASMLILTAFFGYMFFRMIVDSAEGAATVNALLSQWNQMLNAQNPLANQIALPVINVTGQMMMVLFVSCIVLVVIYLVEALAVVRLRMGKGGAGVLQFIQWVHFVLTLLSLIAVGYSYYWYNKNYEAIKAATNSQSASSLGRLVPLEIAGLVIILIAGILEMCYRKDVAYALRTAGGELNTGRKCRYRYTHLSGISTFFGLLCTLAAVMLVITLVQYGRVNIYGYYSQSYTGAMAVISALLALGSPFIQAIKYFTVARCNNNMKMAR